MGRVIGPHGIKGWVKIKTFTQAPDGLMDFPAWWLNTRDGWQEFKIAEVEWRNTGLVGRFDGYDDRSAAEAINGLEVGVPRETLPEPEAGEFYWADLIGLEVVNTKDQPLGVVNRLIETGANDVLVVRDGSLHRESAVGEKTERLIPYIESVIVSVDLTQRRMVVEWDPDY